MWERVADGDGVPMKDEIQALRVLSASPTVLHNMGKLWFTKECWLAKPPVQVVYFHQRFANQQVKSAGLALVRLHNGRHKKGHARIQGVQWSPLLGMV